MAARGLTTQRGYGASHQSARRDALRHFKDGDPCARCHQPMHPDQPLDLDHTDDRTAYTGLAHRSCNRSAGATLGNQNRKPTNRHSRSW